MAVSSKWYVTKPVEGQLPQEVRMHPVVRGVENRAWASATPAGSLSMSVANAAALEFFVPGEEYEAVFVHRPKPAPGDGHPVDVVEQKGWNMKTGQNDKTYWVCGTCGSYASLAEDGTPDWSRHEEMFGAQ